MNKKINKILACLDFSDYTLSVLEHAVELSGESHILVYNIVNQRDVYPVEAVSLYASGAKHALDEIKEMGKQRLEMLKETVKTNFPDERSRISYKVDVGIPAEEILKTVDEQNIDLIVMANKGRGNLSRFLFGSAAEKVFRHSPVPILSIREKKGFKRKK